MTIGIITREWPPAIYGGAGVHVTNLAEALNSLGRQSIDIHCFGSKRVDAMGHDLSSKFAELNPALKTLLIDSDIASGLSNVNLVHSHTWYANFAGYLASKMYSIPHVVTAHSLEPLRPWKAEQLGGGYAISSWAEKISYESADAIIAVSDGMKKDIISSYPALAESRIHTIRNGINTERFTPNPEISILKRYGISQPYALFVGRITRQKGLAHLLRAWREVSKEFTLVVAASSPDEPAIGQEVEELITELQKDRSVIWIREMLPHDSLTALLTQARAFICPSIYEPLGIVNLEAMACETAVIATRVGGIPEVVAEKETGILVDLSSDSASFEGALTKAITELMTDHDRATALGIKGRQRAIAEFSWDKVACATMDLYESLIG